MPLQSSATSMGHRAALHAFFVNITPWLIWIKDRTAAGWVVVQEDLVPLLLQTVTPKTSEDAYRAGVGAVIVAGVALISPSGLSILIASAAGWALVILHLKEADIQHHVKEYAQVISPVVNGGGVAHVPDARSAEELFSRRYQTAWATVTIRQGSPAISDSSGVISSIQYKGVGDYTINWVKAFRDEHYAFWVSGLIGHIQYELTRTGVRLLMRPETDLSLDAVGITIFAIQELDD